MKLRAGVALGVLLLAWPAAVFLTCVTAPRRNTDQQHFDTIIMLGSPADPDGKPSWEERERVTEAVREFKADRANHLIVTGGAAHNDWVEAEVEARLAETLGVPAADVFIEGRSQNTIQNIYYSWQIMQAHGWTSAEVVSNGSHLPRAALILGQYDRFGLKWQTHPSPSAPEYRLSFVVGRYVLEAFETWKLRWFGFPKSPFLPSI